MKLIGTIIVVLFVVLLIPFVLCLGITLYRTLIEILSDNDESY